MGESTGTPNYLALAAQEAADCRMYLREELAKADGVEAIVLLLLIGAATELERGIVELAEAKR